MKRYDHWKHWKTTSTKHNAQILVINITVILGVFIFAAIIQSI